MIARNSRSRRKNTARIPRHPFAGAPDLQRLPVPLPDGPRQPELWPQRHLRDAERLLLRLYARGRSASRSWTIKNSDLILIWGKQPVYAGASKGDTQKLVDAKERGTSFISIKPTLEPDAALAETWVPIRPGTDAALALAMLNVIVNEKLYDEALCHPVVLWL